ncbi:hypothetical protein NDU88_003845 [Pleurodeles waltl]|uniref:Uncharacterized protein n=1 Tax=Pleurodeles waltl TaxID=8319 RepID=A0AAV7UEF0_PLEWA|nr:hypothetical protein NDU88_003845 [Pleurodeles waltl]
MACQISFFWWALTYMKCIWEEEKSLPTALSKHRQLGHVRRCRNPPVYRPLVDLSTMEERHLIITYRFDRATIQELCSQLEADLMPAIRHLTGIPPQALRQQVPFLQEDGPDGCVVAAVEPVDSDEEEAEEEDIDNRDPVIQQYFQ